MSRSEQFIIVLVQQWRNIFFEVSKNQIAITVAPVIKVLNEFFDKRYAKQKAEAKELAQRYYERFKRRPDPEVFNEYFMLFETKSSVLINNVFSNKLKLGNTEKQSIEYMEEHAPEFSNYEEFMRYCFDDEEEK